MISIQKKFLFIHVPKTGGNSVQNILRDYSEDKIVLVASHQDGIDRFEVRNDKYDIQKHSTLSDYKEVLEKEIYDKLFKFSTIRNPWERMISFYFSPNRMVTNWNREDFVALVNRIKPMKNFITLSNQNEDNFSTQHLDFLMKFEQLNSDFQKVCNILQLPIVNLPHRNKSYRNHYSKYYDDELKEMVRITFLDEIEFGNYKFEHQ